MLRVVLAALIVLSVPVLIGAGCGITPPTVDLTEEEQTLFDELEPGAEAAGAAAFAFEDLVASGDDDPVGKLIASLRQRDDVASATTSIDESTVIVEMTNGETISVFTDAKDRAEWAAAPAKALRFDAPRITGPINRAAGDRKVEVRMADVDDFIICDETSFPQSSKACIVLGFRSSFGQDVSKIRTPLERAGYDVQTLNLAGFSDAQTLLRTLSDCGVLYISTHGGVGAHNGSSANLLATEIEIPSGDPAAFATQVQQAAQTFGADEVKNLFSITAANGRSYWALTPEFFSRAAYKGTMVYIDACQSDTAVASGGQQLRDAFLDNGAGAFIGWSDSISTKFSNPATEKIFDGLAPADFGVENIVITTTPSNPSARESYLPTVQVQPPAADIEVRLHIIGSDGFQRSETARTDKFGEIEFSSVPGGASEVTDIITAVTGGADNGATVVNVAVRSDPTLPANCRLPWQNGEVSIASLQWRLGPGKSPGFNIVCNNPDVTSTQEIVKFE